MFESLNIFGILFRSNPGKEEGCIDTALPLGIIMENGRRNNQGRMIWRCQDVIGADFSREDSTAK